MPITIREDDPGRPGVAQLVTTHLEGARSHTPPESAHALEVDELRSSDIAFWTAWDDSLLVGCGALKELTKRHGEIKSMHTVGSHRGRGVGARLLAHIIEEARQRGYERLSLETGSMEAFAAARALYARSGFHYCKPFANYSEDPNSVFMTLDLVTLDGSTS